MAVFVLQQLSCCDKVKAIYSLALYKKWLQTSALNHHEFIEGSQNALKKDVSSIPWPKLKKGKVQGVFFTGEQTVQGTTCPSTLAADTMTVATPPLTIYKGINLLPVSQKQQLPPPLSLLPEFSENVERERRSPGIHVTKKLKPFFL